MAEGFWNRPPAPNYASPAAIKRPRPDLDAHPPGEYPSHGMVHYPPRNDAHLGLQVVQDTKTIGASYDRYLQNVQQMSSFASGVASNLAGAGFIMGVGEMPSAGVGVQISTIEQPVMVAAIATVGPGPIADGQGISFDDQAHAEVMSRPGPQGPAVPLPPDASSTLFVEGLPRDCIEREHSGSSILLCFVDFADAACAMTAMIALQGLAPDLVLGDRHYQISKEINLVDLIWAIKPEVLSLLSSGLKL
ncbi:hypothetical protein Taro_032474 [Colocasia esculenta]|uniref:Uncharacterized protein n=1 Tax=Colocasia esculenta TaxID=4460 RepID=A0A843VXF3_COLES|nr:hypothetical protein [Colocasia esculenta]